MAVNVGAMILVFIAFIALFNAILVFFGDLTGINNFISENTIYDQLSLDCEKILISSAKFNVLYQMLNLAMFFINHFLMFYFY